MPSMADEKTKLEYATPRPPFDWRVFLSEVLLEFIVLVILIAAIAFVLLSAS